MQQPEAQKPGQQKVFERPESFCAYARGLVTDSQRVTWAAIRNSCDVFSSIFERFVLFWGKLQHNGDQLITLGKPHICPYMGKANKKSRHGFHRPP